MHAMRHSEAAARADLSLAGTTPQASLTMHLRLEDSEAAALTPTAEGWTLRLSAASVQRAASGAAGPGARINGHLSGVSLLLEGRDTACGSAHACAAGRIREATLRWRASTAHEWTHLRTLPLPGELQGECELSVQIGLAEPFTWRGARLRVMVADDACFRESWAC